MLEKGLCQLLLANLPEIHSSPLLAYSPLNCLTTNPLTVPPRLSPFQTSILQLNMGDRASLTCSVVKGDLPLTINWRKDSRPIDPTQHMSVKQVDQYNSILVIDNLGSDHTGNYSCVVRNSAAEVENSQALLVNGKENVTAPICIYNVYIIFIFS